MSSLYKGYSENNACRSRAVHEMPSGAELIPLDQDAVELRLVAEVLRLALVPQLPKRDDVEVARGRDEDVVVGALAGLQEAA
eukprot:15753433-Heterocapsa_arctica.AAC.1